MSPETFYRDVYNTLLEGANNGREDISYRSAIGDVGIYLTPHSGHIHDFVIDEEYRQQGYGKQGIQAAIEVIEEETEVKRPSVIATIRQTNAPDTSYGDSERQKETDPTHRLLAANGFASIHEIESSAVTGEYAFEARR